MMKEGANKRYKASLKHHYNGPIYDEFSYSNTGPNYDFSQKKTFLIDIDVKKGQLQ